MVPTEPRGQTAMVDLDAMIREYCGLLDEERRLGDRKDALKRAIVAAMAAANLPNVKTPAGSVDRASRFKLTPRRDEILSLLDAEDLFPFAQFTPAKVTQHLVPRYGREVLLPLFKVDKTEYIMVHRPSGASRPTGDPSEDPS